MKKLKLALLALSMGFGFGVSYPTMAAPDPQLCADLADDCHIMRIISACREYNRLCRH
ncbi:hypothetical protein [Massilia sp. BJB1822]|uniref:hypothetical protein n=1 Tax=Massilia sp. BJB1822 TaxID=2744470 RepID=UPI00159434A2|nr:hypothetical protein [Massilia sp. BJB1822]NVD98835.1 hypothetical protein [Massilia sp. BJB1822]